MEKGTVLFGMSKCLVQLGSEKIDELIIGNEKICEDIQRLELRNNSMNILYRVKRTNPSLFNFECIYQNYRVRFSNAYFSGSDYNIGECFVDYIVNDPESLKILFGTFIFGHIARLL